MIRAIASAMILLCALALGGCASLSSLWPWGGPDLPEPAELPDPREDEGPSWLPVESALAESFARFGITRLARGGHDSDSPGRGKSRPRLRLPVEPRTRCNPGRFGWSGP